MDKVTVFFLPFAGGAKYSYKGFSRSAPEHIRVVSLELPGRGSRIAERLLTVLDEMVEDLYRQITTLIDGPYAIYGHSMGALVGYLLTKRLIGAPGKKPVHLFFTGSRAPSAQKEQMRHLLPRDEFLKELKELGGSPDEVLDDPAMMNLFEPILRADFQAIETYRYEPAEPFTMPITVITGTQEQITVSEAEAWRVETTGPVQVLRLPGKHFFIYDHEPLIMQLVGRQLLPQILPIL